MQCDRFYRIWDRRPSSIETGNLGVAERGPRRTAQRSGQGRARARLRAAGLSARPRADLERENDVADSPATATLTPFRIIPILREHRASGFVDRARRTVVEAIDADARIAYRRARRCRCEGGPKFL